MLDSGACCILRDVSVAMTFVWKRVSLVVFLSIFHRTMDWVQVLTFLLYPGIALWWSRQSSYFFSSSIYSWDWHGGRSLCCSPSTCCYWVIVCRNQRGKIITVSVIYMKRGVVCFPIFDWLGIMLQSTVAQGIVTTANVCAMMFVILAGGYLGFKTGWVGYELPTG